MKTATAQLSNYRQSPRKVGLVVGLVRGKRVNEALVVLDAMPKRAAEPVAKLIRSAVANARTKGISQDDLVVSKMTVGQGVVFKRSMPRARGSMSMLQKKSSHVTVELSHVEPKAKTIKKVSTKAKAPKAVEAEATE